MWEVKLEAFEMEVGSLPGEGLSSQPSGPGRGQPLRASASEGG